MEDSAAFGDRLEQALKSRIDQMENVDLRQLRDDFKLFMSAFQAITNVLLKKGLIHEDPYKYDLKISDVGLPPETPFSDTEKLDQMCIRLSQFESYLDFLNNYYQFSVDFLTPGRIKRLAALAKYFNFMQFTENSQHINTRYFAELVSAVKKGSDTLSAGIVNEGLLQLDKASRKIFQTLKDLTTIHKERFKLELRQFAVVPLSLERDYVVTHQDDVVKKLRQKFMEVSGERQFFPELAVEVLNEDFGSDGQSLRDEIIKKLGVVPEKNQAQQQESSFKAALLDGARLLIGVGFQLEDAIKKLEENQTVLDASDRSLMAKVKKALREMFGQKGQHVVHEVDYLDPVTSQRKVEAIDFTTFMQDAAKRAQGFVSMASRTGPAYRRLEGSSEDLVYKFLTKAIEDLQSYHKKMSALDDFFLGALAETELKARYRSIKIELGSIKNAIIKANQKKHEYIAQKEEQEQLRKLGVRDQ